ncbi:hypothetical protein B0H19DRAFT_1243940 [Mycena capillaripes]|nr:hypothetical protein B0H19DRAFT_1243940 [Mycena capillaripes]
MPDMHDDQVVKLLVPSTSTMRRRPVLSAGSYFRSKRGLARADPRGLLVEFQAEDGIDEEDLIPTQQEPVARPKIAQRRGTQIRTLDAEGGIRSEEPQPIFTVGFSHDGGRNKIKTELALIRPPLAIVKANIVNPRSDRPPLKLPTDATTLAALDEGTNLQQPVP